jgi:putative addiction module killer protein
MSPKKPKAHLNVPKNKSIQKPITPLLPVNTPKLYTIEEYQTKNEKKPFQKFLTALKNEALEAKIDRRIYEQVRKGNFGNHRMIDGNLLELKFDDKPPCRIYCGIKEIDGRIIVLYGGTKHRQQDDIDKAREYWDEFKQRDN